MVSAPLATLAALHPPWVSLASWTVQYNHTVFLA